LLTHIGQHFQNPATRHQPTLNSVSSGHGIGKSALVAMLTLWAMCQPDCKAVITAKTEVQLRTKTWPELAKWYRPALHKTWFNFGATSITSRDAKHERSCDATWCRGRKPIPKRLLACTTRETASYWCSMKPPPSSTWCGKWPKVLSPTNA
jgi:hypothetical protein